MKNIILLLTSIYVLTSCAEKKNSIVAIKSGEDVYHLDLSAKKAMADKSNKDKVICKSYRKTGTHFKTSGCTAKSKINNDRINARNLIERNSEIVNKNRTPPGG